MRKLISHSVVSAIAVGVLGGCQNQISSGLRPHEQIPLSWQMQWDRPLPFDTPPKLIRGEAPIYPITQLYQLKSGSAVISFTIDEQGKTRDFKVLSADYSYYASHAILALQKWQFEPARKNGRPVTVHLRVPFRYRIHV